MTDPATDNYQHYTSYKMAEDHKRLSFIVNSVKRLNNKNLDILDIGCGNGNISMALGSLGYNIKGIDIDQESIHQACNTNKFNNVRFEVNNAEELISKEKFNVIICSEILEHLDRPEAMIYAAKKILKKNGILIVTVPNGYGPRELLVTQPTLWLNKKGFEHKLLAIKQMFGYSGQTTQSSNPDLTHVQFFTKKSLFKILTAGGFELFKFQNANVFEKVFPISMVAKRSYFLQRLDCNLADVLPSFMSSGYYTSWVHKP